MFQNFLLIPHSNSLSADQYLRIILHIAISTVSVRSPAVYNKSYETFLLEAPSQLVDVHGLQSLKPIQHCL